MTMLGPITLAAKAKEKLAEVEAEANQLSHEAAREAARADRAEAKGFAADATTRWAHTWQIGRLRIGYSLMRHRYPQGADRWVLHPRIVYDRKGRAA